MNNLLFGIGILIGCMLVIGFILAALPLWRNQ
jgi:hypothetical protein